MSGAPTGAVVALRPAANVGGFSAVGVLPVDRTNWSSEMESVEVVENSDELDAVRRSVVGLLLRRPPVRYDEVLADLPRLVIVSPWGQASPRMVQGC